MSLVPFKRESFVKDLFQTKYILNAFSEITFESLGLLLDSYQNEFFRTGGGNRLRVILGEDEIPLLIKFLETTDLSNLYREFLVGKNDLFLHVNPSCLTNSSFLSLLEKDSPFSISLNLDEIELSDLETFYKKAESIRSWFSKRKVEIRSKLDKHNYKNQISSVIEIYNKTSFRFFDFSFDYESLSELSFVQFEDLRYRMLELSKSWVNSDNRKGHSFKLSFNGSTKKRIYVDQDFKLYINSYAKRDGEYILDLDSLGDTPTGESVDLKILNKFRSYIDCDDYIMNFIPDEVKKSNTSLTYLVDAYFNKKMTRSYIFIPSITKTLIISLI